MRRLRVALIWGGMGREHDVSRMGAMNLLSVLDKKKFNVHSVYIDKKGYWHLFGGRGEPIYPARGDRGGVLSGDGGRVAIDVALPLLHGDFGEDGRVQGALECAGIPYVGCGVLAGAVASDKILTKMIAESLGIPTARSVSLTSQDTADARRKCEEYIGYPMFIKPSGLGSSVGCSRVLFPEDFDAAYKAAAECGERVLAEEYIEGAREIECAYSNTSRFGEIYAPPGEVVPRGVYTYRAKYSASTTARVLPRAELTAKVSECAEKYSRLLVRAIGISQLGRIDYFLKDDRLILNEINTMPGFTQGSLYAAMLAECGIELSELLTSLIEDAHDRRF